MIVLPTFLLLLDAGMFVSASPCSLKSSIARPVIGYTSTFTGIVGFYMSVAFYGISLFINVICTGTSAHLPRSTPSNITDLGPAPLSLSIRNHRACADLPVCIMWRVYRLTREFQAVNNRKSKLKIWKVIEATVQSTAIYSAAAVSLVITFVNSTAVGYPTCLNVFPALIVCTSRPRPL